MKKIYIGIWLILIFLLLKFIITLGLNGIFVWRYDNEDYGEGILKLLSVCNISQPYIVHYNHGNVLYQEEFYYDACEEYYRALELFPSEKRECEIRINLALALLQTIDMDDRSMGNLSAALGILNEAKEVLFEHGCAHKNDDNGHNSDAEQLKREIESLEEELEELRQQQQEGQKEETKPMDEREYQLKEIQKESIKERQEELDNGRQLIYYEYYDSACW